MSRQSEPDEGERLGASGRTYSSRSFFLLSTDHPLRRTFIDVIEWPWFDRAVLLLICLNCAFLAVQGPPGYEEAPFRDATAGSIEMFFQIMFTVEMLCKWVAMGLVAHKTAYARDGWNLLDMTVVIAGWVPIILKALGLPGNKNISAIRLANPNPNRNPNPNASPNPIPNPNPNPDLAAALGGVIRNLVGDLPSNLPRRDRDLPRRGGFVTSIIARSCHPRRRRRWPFAADQQR